MLLDILHVIWRLFDEFNIPWCGLLYPLRIAGYINKYEYELAREDSIHYCVGEAGPGGSMQSIKKKIQCWLDKQHMTLWQGLAGTQRQAQELISSPRIAAKTRLLSFNRTQSRVVICLLTRHNTLRRHLHIMGLRDSPLCRKCRAEEETSAHVLCERKALVTHRHTYWVPSF
jgi:hypothetical protein